MGTPEEEWINFILGEWEKTKHEDPVDPLAEAGVRLVSFESTSNGKRKKKRAPREINLVIDSENSRAQVLKDIPTGWLDSLAWTLLGQRYGDEYWEEFTRRLGNQNGDY